MQKTTHEMVASSRKYPCLILLEPENLEFVLIIDIFWGEE